MFDDENAPKKAVSHTLGQDLSVLSLEEIDERVRQLHAEIARLGVERAKKEAVKGAADALFRKG